MDAFDVAIAAFFKASDPEIPTWLDGPPGGYRPYDVDDEIGRLIRRLSEWAQETFPGESPG